MKKHLALFVSISFLNFLFAQDVFKTLDIKEKNDTLSFLKKGLIEIQILDGRKKYLLEKLNTTGMV